MDTTGPGFSKNNHNSPYTDQQQKEPQVTKKEFIALLKDIYACQESIDWCQAQHSFEDIKKCSNGEWWSWLLQAQPQFAEYCDWANLNGEDWRRLLQTQPQFAEHCDWTKLDGYNWSCLLRAQPQLAEHCDWRKLDGYDWSWLLQEQPQLSIHRPTK